jgi:hypothetical protein
MRQQHDDEKRAMEMDFKRQRAAMLEESNAATTALKTDYDRAMTEINEKMEQLTQVC